MIKKTNITIVDGNEAVADIAYRINEICIIYPITPATQMGEWADQWSAQKVPNIWQTIPDVIEMQSEIGVAGALHGALQTGALATTFTSSQGLLLMIPNMFRIAAELSPTVFHVATRVVAPHGMTIYCEHSDVMAVRNTGFALLCSSSVQEAHDMALITQVVSLKSRVPFVHFFDGFRTSHEVAKITRLIDDQIAAMIDTEDIIEHRRRRMRPDNPFVRGAIYNSDIFFQQREAISLFYEKTPKIVDECLQHFKTITGRDYKIVEYFGHPRAEYVIVIMGSSAETVYETVAYLKTKGEKVGLLKVRLFQPFSKTHLLQELPKTCKAIAVLDRTKEPGAGGEPLYQKVATAILEAHTHGILPTKVLPKIIGGRYGIGSKEFTPAMVKTIFAELGKLTPKNNFTIGIDDDILQSSLEYDENFNIESDKVIRAVFYGLGADGTVSANKNTAKIIGEQTNFDVQGYFIYDAKKSGSRTISHLRFSPNRIHSTYLISTANFIGCHQFSFIEKLDILKYSALNATFLLNSPYDPETTWNRLVSSVQEAIINKRLKFYVIDAYKVARESGVDNRINIIMQTCFFALAKILPREQAIIRIKDSIAKTYENKGEQVIKQNFIAVDHTLANLRRVKVPNEISSKYEILPIISDTVPDSVRYMVSKMLFDRGGELPVSALSPDGTYSCGTTMLEKRNVSLYAPVWNQQTCIQCGLCSLVCPHSVLRAKYYGSEYLKDAPESFKSAKMRGKSEAGHYYTLQSYPEDCTGCGLCVEACPVRGKAISLQLKQPLLKTKKINIKFFESLPQPDRNEVNASVINEIQYLQPLFEFCGACAGCGEAPYVKLISQLFGDRMIIANSCGCSSVFGGNLPTIPWTSDQNGNGPSWSSSLFEDNAEFGFGFRLTADKLRQKALELLGKLLTFLNKSLVTAIRNNPQDTETQIVQQRRNVSELKQRLNTIKDRSARDLLSIADFLVKQSIWAIGGDGWAYDIGFGGLDHVIACDRDINLLVLDTEVYSNTGGQASKATPRGSVVKFAASGKSKAKKDLGLMAISYGDVYVANIALGADPVHAIKALKEAESYPGPSLVIAYCQCIAHGIDMRQGMRQQQLAVKCGYWPLYRYNPERTKQKLNPFQLDSKKPSISFKEYAMNENRFRILARHNPKQAEHLMQLAQDDIDRRWRKYQSMAEGCC
ncbi:MAG: pyruvate-flavodoxin oxidoreductase [Coxiella sp. DG_40]|nr:MAG: pyruvate-flavodoxin oxidoreductase [Coxiella sp. DG_40]